MFCGSGGKVAAECGGGLGDMKGSGIGGCTSVAGGTYNAGGTRCSTDKHRCISLRISSVSDVAA